jgi:phage terminase large subunit GpA-like protein
MTPRTSTVPIPNNRRHLFGVFARSVRPRPLTTVSQWADTHRILTSKSSGEPGRWRTDRTPYLREIMDALSETSTVEEISLMFGAQLGKTEAGLNWIGYTMDHAPAPMLVVLPTIEVRGRWAQQRVNPLLTETACIRAIFDASRRRDAANSEGIKDFPGGILVIGGANSPASLASMPIARVLCDEVDRFPLEAGREGSTLDLIKERTKTFPRRKICYVSTPTIEGESEIEKKYNASDMREFHVPCPHCGERQVLEWTHADGTHGLRVSAASGHVFYACVHCGERIEEHHKTRMLAAGVWIPRHPERAARGYHLNGLYSPIGLGFTWAELWDQWTDAQSDTAKLKRFINTALAQTWKIQGDGIEAIGLLARLETYPADRPVYARTAWCDVQKDRLEYTVCEWGAGEECWAITHVIIPGDTTQPDVWEALADDYDALDLDAAGVDAGYNTSQVKAFVRPRKWCWPTKGVPGSGRSIVEDQLTRKKRLRRRRKDSVPVEPIGVDNAKALIYSRLKLPKAGPKAGQGYVHFPSEPEFDDEYFQQLGAEKLTKEKRAGQTHYVWVQIRPRNEALDCMVGNLAVLRLWGGLESRVEAKTLKDGRRAPQAGPVGKISLADWGKKRGDENG